MIMKHRVSIDPDFYQAWPDIALTNSGKLVCVFSECTHHGNRDYTRIVTVESTDRGRKWSKKRPVTESTRGKDYYYNCARITRLADDRLCIIVDRMEHGKESAQAPKAINLLYFSCDEGRNWSRPQTTPLHGIVPDKLLETESGRWIISAHYPSDGFLSQFMHYSDDEGKSWSREIIVAKKSGMNLCEVSILPVGENKLVAFMRENSGSGMDCMKTISDDNGETWSDVYNFPIPGCHRPVSGRLQDGHIMITYRFMQGGNGWLGKWTQNFFGAISDTASALSESRKDAWVRIMPIDYDRSPKSDLGYSGWVQFPDGEIYVVQYIVDDAITRAQIRGYSFFPNEFTLPEPVACITKEPVSV